VPGTNLLVDLPAGKNPVSMLHELYGSSEIAINDDVASETPGIFIASVCVEQQNFQVWKLQTEEFHSFCLADSISLNFLSK